MIEPQPNTSGLGAGGGVVLSRQHRQEPAREKKLRVRAW